MEKESIGARLKHAWNAFMNRDPTISYPSGIGPSSSYRPDQPRFHRGNERSIVTAIYNRIAVDVASIDIYHCRLDEQGRFAEYINSGLNNCLRMEANIDQSGRALIQDIVMSMLDEGCVAVVPVETDIDATETESYKILQLRTAQIVEWFPEHVRLRMYNERSGRREDVVLPKKMVAIIENPFYAIMNEPNSMMQRLIHKLALLDVADDNTASGKMDMIIQLPYVIKTEGRKNQAEERRKDIEMQLTGSKYGIAYIDGTEKITQLNRPVENNLLTQIEYLTKQVQSQLGITDEILSSTANEQTMLNYNNRTIEPIVSAIVNEFNRRFLTKTARTQRQTISFRRDPFRLVPVNNLADIADKFTRNEIMSSNEFRSIVGLMPSKDPKADQLRNSNLNHPDEKVESQPNTSSSTETNANNAQTAEITPLEGIMGTKISDLT